MADKPIGEVTHYFDKIGVAVIKLNAAGLSVGAKVKFQTKDGEFEQTIESMQIEHKQIDKAKSGDEFGLKTDKPVEKGDKLFLL